MSQDLRLQATKHVQVSRRRRAMLPHLGNLFLSKIYRALGGHNRLPILLKRAVANGLNREHIEAILRQAKTAADLPRLLYGIGENHFQRGLYWHDVGVKSRARDHYLESSLWHLYAAIAASTPALQSRALARCESSYLLAAPHFANPAELVLIQCPAGTLSGYLRLPTAKLEEEEAGESFINATYPCALLFNAFNAPKEELHLTENALLASGTATLSFDYPGYGEGDAAELCNFSSDELCHSLMLFLASRAEIDMSRLALFGTGIGGRLALYVAAKLPDRFRAVACLSAPLDLLSDMQLLLPAMQRELAVSAGCSKAALFDLARRTPLRAMLPEMTTPLLVVGGGRDVIAMPQETRAIYEECGAADKKLMICVAAGHGCHEMMPSLRHEIAQWIRQRL